MIYIGVLWYEYFWTPGLYCIQSHPFRQCHNHRSCVDPTLYWLCFLCPVSLFAVDMERDWMIAWSVVMMKTLLQHSADCAFSFVSDLLYIQRCSSVVVIRILFYPFEQYLKIACIYVLFVLIDSDRPSAFPCAITDSPLCTFVSLSFFFWVKVLLCFSMYCILHQHCPQLHIVPITV